LIGLNTSSRVFPTLVGVVHVYAPAVARPATVFPTLVGVVPGSYPAPSGAPEVFPTLVGVVPTLALLLAL